MAAADPQIVANVFPKNYYDVLLKNPDSAYKFYDDSSLVSWPEDSDGKVATVTTMESIKSLIMSQDHEGCQVKVDTIDGQASSAGGVIVVVTGTWKGKDAAQRFTETFFLAPRQGKEGVSYYVVLNDIFKFVGEPVDLTPSSSSSSSEAEEEEEEALSPQVLDAVVVEQALPVQDPKSSPSLEGGDKEEEEEVVVVPPPKEEVLRAPPPAAAVEEQKTIINSSKTQTAVVTKSSSETTPKNNKISYAVMAAKEATTNSGEAIANKNKVVVVASSSNHYDPLKPKTTTTKKESPAAAASSNNTNNNTRREGRSIYIGNLPTGVETEHVKDFFKRFGAIRKGGVRVIPREDGFCFGFVEFQSAESATAAIQARYIFIGQNEVYITPKRTSNHQSFTSSNGGRGPATAASNYTNTSAADTQEEGRGIYISNLPSDVTIEHVHHVFQSFGSIKEGGIRVITRHDGFCFGFVEFESADSASAAIQQHKITIDQYEAYITAKKTPNRRYSNNVGGGGDAVNNIGRPPSADRGSHAKSQS